MLIPLTFIITDVDSSDAVTSTSATPVGATTSATLTFVQSTSFQTNMATNWRLDITAYEDESFGVSGILNAMQTIATDNNYYPTFFNSPGQYVWHNNADMTNDGISLIQGTSDITVSCENGYSTPGTYTYTNTAQTNSSSDQIGTQANNSTAYQMLNYITIVLTIQQSPTKVLTYNTNGGTFASTPTTVTYATGTTVTLATDISKPGYNFAGWNYNGNIVSQVTLNDNITVTATWTAATYTVTFNANGGTTPTASKTVTYNQQYGTLPVPTRSGDYFFIGWYTQSSGGSLVISSDTYTLTTDQTLYAHWGQSTLAVTPTGASTSATLTFVSTGTFSNSPATNWRLEITGYEDTILGAEIPLSVMETLATYYNYYPTHFNSIGMYSWHNNTNMVNDGIAIVGQSGKITVVCNNVFGTPATYTYNNRININSSSDQIGTQASNSPAYQMLNYITIVFNVMVEPNKDITYDTNGGIFATTPTTTYPTGTVVTLPTDITKTGYEFSGWLYNNEIVQQITLSDDVTVVAQWTPNEYEVTFDANEGTVNPDTMTVTYNEDYGPMPTPTRAGYTFKGWYTQAVDGDLVVSENTYTLTSDQTLYAHWTETIAYWNNGNPNGLISILYRIDNPNVTNDIITKAHIYSFNPDIADDPATQINESFTDTGYYIQIEVLSTKIGNSYDVKIIARLYDSNANMIVQNYYDFGSWRTFIVTIDTINAKVDYTKVMGFRSFTDYEETVSGTILSYASYGDFNNQAIMDISINPITDTVPRQSVVKTLVFLNTYGVVLRNPTLDVSTYFPEMTQMRLNFYSFALYGTSMTINGHTIPVIAPNVTIYYTQDGTGKNTIADEPGQRTLEKTIELTNIYITWDGTNCTLTFANENFTVDMGTYTDKTISFAGMWYFATGLYEPYTATESTYEVDWYNGFDLSTFGIIFATMLLLGALAIRVTVGARFMDYIIIVCGIIIALILAGGS